MDTLTRPLQILHIDLGISETNNVYNEHCLPMHTQYNISICTFFKPSITPSIPIRLFPGDDSFSGFFRALRQACDEADYDIIHIHSQHVGLLFIVANMLMRRNLLSKTAFTVHNSYQNFKFRNKVLLLPVFAFFKRVVCCGQESYKSFPPFFKWLAGRRLHAIQNGTNLQRIDQVIKDHKSDKQRTGFTVASIGTLNERKNPFIVLKAFQQSCEQNAQLIFMGHGPLYDPLVTKSKRLGISTQVNVCGLVPRDEVYLAMAQADLFISTSYGEGLPIAALEAMACRLPVLLSDIGPHRELAKGADFIPLIEPNNIAGFARELERFQEMPTSERIAIGRKCRELVQSRFSLEIMHEQYRSLYVQDSM